MTITRPARQGADFANHDEAPRLQVRVRAPRRDRHQELHPDARLSPAPENRPEIAARGFAADLGPRPFFWNLAGRVIPAEPLRDQPQDSPSPAGAFRSGDGKTCGARFSQLPLDFSLQRARVPASRPAEPRALPRMTDGRFARYALPGQSRRKSRSLGTLGLRRP